MKVKSFIYCKDSIFESKVGQMWPIVNIKKWVVISEI